MKARDRRVARLEPTDSNRDCPSSPDLSSDSQGQGLILQTNSVSLANAVGLKAFAESTSVRVLP